MLKNESFLKKRFNASRGTVGILHLLDEVHDSCNFRGINLASLFPQLQFPSAARLWNCCAAGALFLQQLLCFDGELFPAAFYQVVLGMKCGTVGPLPRFQAAPQSFQQLLRLVQINLLEKCQLVRFRKSTEVHCPLPLVTRPLDMRRCQRSQSWPNGGDVADAGGPSAGFPQQRAPLALRD